MVECGLIILLPAIIWYYRLNQLPNGSIFFSKGKRGKEEKKKSILLVRGNPAFALVEPHRAQDLVAEVLKERGHGGDWLAVPAQLLTVLAEMGGETRLVIFLGMTPDSQVLAKRIRAEFPNATVFVVLSQDDEVGSRLAVEIAGSRVYFVEVFKAEHYRLGYEIAEVFGS